MSTPARRCSPVVVASRAPAGPVTGRGHRHDRLAAHVAQRVGRLARQPRERRWADSAVLMPGERPRISTPIEARCSAGGRRCCPGCRAPCATLAPAARSGATHTDAVGHDVLAGTPPCGATDRWPDLRTRCGGDRRCVHAIHSSSAASMAPVHHASPDTLAEAQTRTFRPVRCRSRCCSAEPAIGGHTLHWKREPSTRRSTSGPVDREAFDRMIDAFYDRVEQRRAAVAVLSWWGARAASAQCGHMVGRGLRRTSLPTSEQLGGLSEC